MEDHRGVQCFESIERVVYPSLAPALVLGQDISHYSDSLMYGELSPETLAYALELIKTSLPPPGEGSLIDIGSGIGRAVFIAACLYPWKQCSGIEIYEKRARLAMEALKRWNAHVFSRRNESCGAHDEDRPLPPTKLITFTRGDVVDEGVDGYDVLLLVSAAFTDTLMAQIAAVLELAPVGTLAICITKAIPSSSWETLHSVERDESWGRAVLIIQKKVR